MVCVELAPPPPRYTTVQEKGLPVSDQIGANFGPNGTTTTAAQLAVTPGHKHVGWEVGGGGGMERLGECTVERSIG
jgi:hypothetical protein